MRHHRITRPAALSLALIALAAPAASAKIHNETVVGTSQAVAIGTPIRDETVLRPVQTAPIRDETILQPPATSAHPSPAHSVSGITWGDAAIGAGGLLGLILLGTTGAYAVAHHRRNRPDQLLTVSDTSRGGAR